jgi:predicted membrane channel-forming protein YqfA (hemolysin III family)
MNNLLTWIKENPIRSMFLVPIFLVAGISISHVVAWYDITNPFSWAIYLSVAIEIGAITALIAATQKIKGGVWFMFGLVTFVQMVGNIFYSYKEIDPNGELFKSWVELTSPIFEMFGTEPTDIISHKRWLAILGGGLLPVISLTSLHFFVKYEKSEKVIENDRDL